MAALEEDEALAHRLQAELYADEGEQHRIPTAVRFGDEGGDPIRELQQQMAAMQAQLTAQKEAMMAVSEGLKVLGES